MITKNTIVYVTYKDKFYQVIYKDLLKKLLYYADSAFYFHKDKTIFIKNKFSDSGYTPEDITVIRLAAIPYKEWE